MGKQVGEVLVLEGGTLVIDRGGRVAPAREGAAFHVGDVLETKGQAKAVLEFDLGGQAVMGPGTKAEIVSDTEARQTGKPLTVRAGSVWAKFKEQKSAFQIQTAAGVIGIEDVSPGVPSSGPGFVSAGTRPLGAGPGGKDARKRDFRELLKARGWRRKGD